MAQTVEGTQGELARRHAAAANVAKLVGVFTLLFMPAALTGSLSGAVRFTAAGANTLRFVVVFLGVGAIVYGARGPAMRSGHRRAARRVGAARDFADDDRRRRPHRRVIALLAFITS